MDHRILRGLLLAAGFLARSLNARLRLPDWGYTLLIAALIWLPINSTRRWQIDSPSPVPP